MASKIPVPLLDRLRSGVAALGDAAGRALRRLRGETPGPSTPEPSAPEPPAAEPAPAAPPRPERPPAARRKDAAPAPRPAPKPAVAPTPRIDVPPRAAPPPAEPVAAAAPPPPEAPRSTPASDPISDTFAALRAVRRAFGGLEAWPLPVRPWRNDNEAPAVPAGATFARHTFACAAGSRDYRLYVPASIGARPNGLVVMLHGCRQTPEDFALGTRMNEAAERLGFLVAYPHQPRSANPNGCWNWYRLSDQLRHGGEPAILAGIVHEVMEKWGVTREKVFVAGLSAGAAMTSILTRTHPELFAAACVHSGVAAGLADDLRSGLAAMKGRFAATPPATSPAPAEIVPTLVIQGDADAVVDRANADRIFALLDPGDGGPVRVETRTHDGIVSTVTTRADAKGRIVCEMWHVADGIHAWFGGDPEGSYAVPTGPDSTAEMLRFFAAQGPRAKRSAVRRPESRVAPPPTP
jgi:poly(hydroxyalkanoate) depolymerase family esterase